MQNPIVLFVIIGFVVAAIVIAKLLQARKKKQPTFNYSVHVTQKGHAMPLDVTLTNEQKVKVTLTPVTESGQLALLDGIPAWTVVSDGGSIVSADADGMSAYLISGDAPGDTTFLIEADADLGAGVENISDTIVLHVQGAKAKNLGLTVGTPETK